MKNEFLAILIAIISLTCIFTFAACNADAGHGTMQTSGEATNAETEGEVTNAETEEETLKPSEGLEFLSNNDGTCCVQGIGSCKDSDIVIPSTSPGGLRVTSIGKEAFADNADIKSVIIPKSITDISKGAFLNCTSLTSVTMSDGVASIGDHAFYRCTALTSITLPDSVTSIGTEAFTYCISLESISIPDGITSIGSNAFRACPSIKPNEYDNAYYLGNADNPYIILVVAKNNSVTSCIINGSAKFIRPNAFAYCPNLTSVTFVNTSGWQAGSTSISPADIANTSTAATYLKDNYCSIAWTRG